MLLLSPLYRQEKWGLERVSNLLRPQGWEVLEAGVQEWAVWPQSPWSSIYSTGSTEQEHSAALGTEGEAPPPHSVSPINCPTYPGLPLLSLVCHPGTFALLSIQPPSTLVQHKSVHIPPLLTSPLWFPIASVQKVSASWPGIHSLLKCYSWLGLGIIIPFNAPSPQRRKKQPLFFPGYTPLMPHFHGLS